MYNFELGKTYIVDVTASGIMPVMEFDQSRWYDKDHDDLDFLTDEEKIVLINQVLDKIKAEIQDLRGCSCSNSDGIIDDVEDIIDKYIRTDLDKSEEERDPLE